MLLFRCPSSLRHHLSTPHLACKLFRKFFPTIFKPSFFNFFHSAPATAKPADFLSNPRIADFAFLSTYFLSAESSLQARCDFTRLRAVKAKPKTITEMASMGGKARAAKLTKKRRVQIARLASRARNNNNNN